MEYDELWGISYKRLREYFSSLPGAESRGKGVFSLGGGEVRLTGQPDAHFGSLCIPRTRVELRGPRAEELHRALTLRFLSAGG